MKLFSLLILSFIFSCVQSEKKTDELPVSVTEVSLMPRLLQHDTVNRHPFEIPFLKWNQSNGSFRQLDEGVTKLRFSNFTLKIEGVLWRMDEESKDTLTISEDVGIYISGRTMWIEPQDTSDQFEFFMSVNHNIFEQYEPENQDDINFDWEKWDDERLKMTVRSDYYRIRDSAGYYRLPWVQESDQFFSKRFKRANNFTDTLRHIPGEMGGSTAVFFIDNKFCTYGTDFAMFKIRKTNHQGQVTNHFFKLWFSYGC